MPITYNGVGTRYSGKRNAESRPGVCQLCGRETTLESYDTRLWFVILFIPVIPLGHKRIINACPACQRHQVLDLDKWETAKQLSISGALEKFHTDPSPEAAMVVHQQLIGFHQTAQADEFAQIIVGKFPDHAGLHAYLGASMLGLRRVADSERYFNRALELRADLPEARAGVAARHIREGKLDEARTLLDFLEKPGASHLYSLAPLEQLADAFQKALRHEEALDLYSQLLSAFPAIGEIKNFRQRIKTSEKALDRRETVLPKQKFSVKRLFSGGGARRQANGITLRGVAIFAALVLLVCIGFAIGNEYVRRNRTLYFVNTTGVPATVTVQGVGSVRVGKTVAQMTLKEGSYHASIAGALPEEFDFQITTDYFERWGGDPVWVINVGGQAVLVRQRVTYSRHPEPPSFTWSFGQSFVSFGEVTHPFQDLPATLQLKSNETKRLSHLEVFDGPPSEAVTMMAETEGQAALALGELELKRHPQDEALLNTYFVAGLKLKQSARMERFLEAGLSQRPVVIPWHRLYQNLLNAPGKKSEVAALYDQLLLTEPNNSALLYLRGRANSEGSNPWFEKARAADASNPYPYFALGYNRMSAGDWTEARPLLARAVELKPGDPQFEEFYWQARMGLGRFAELEKEARSKIQAEALNFNATYRLCTLLALQQRAAETKSLIASFQRRAESINPEQGATAAASLRRGVLYTSGDFAALQKESAGDRSPAGRAMLYSALVEQGRLVEATRYHPLNDANPELTNIFAMSLAWHLANDPQNAAAWFARGLELLEKSDPEDAKIAALLAGAAPPQIAGIESLAPKTKAILYALLAIRHPSKRAEFNAEARRFNIDYSYPHHLIQRATEPVQ